MHIVHIIFSFNLGGAELMLIDIINEQIKTNKVSLIIVNNYNPDLLDKMSPNVDVILIKRQPGSRKIYPILKLNYILSQRRIDVLHCHDEGLLSLFLFKRKKAVLTLHTTGIESNNFTKYRSLFSISNAVRLDLLSRYKINSIVIYNGVQPFKIKMKKENISFPKREIRLLQVSRLDHKTKGQDILIKAISQLINTNTNINISLDFIGEGSSLSYLKGLTNELQINNSVNFLGIRDRSYVYSHIADYDILIQPSLYEGFGLTIVEAMFAKVPVIVSNIEGPMEIIGTGEFGYYFEKGDVDDLLYTLNRIVNGLDKMKDLDLIYNYAQSNFSIQETVEQYQKYYKIS